MAKLEVPVVLIPAMLPDMPVRFEPSIAGRVPVKFAAGKLVSDAPEPTESCCYYRSRYGHTCISCLKLFITTIVKFNFIITSFRN